MPLQVLDDQNGAAVDWWFIYKLPRHATQPADTMRGKDKQKSTGHEYLYLDAHSTQPLMLAEGPLDGAQSALTITLAQLQKSESMGWIAYNDERPGTDRNNGEMGHSKGVLAFDLKSNRAFWLLHSWPKFPTLDGDEVPAPSFEYGQTYLCIELENVETANRIAEQMRHQQEPQLYDCVILDALDHGSSLYQLSQGVNVNETAPPCDISFHSRSGMDFRLLAKNRHWCEDFWIDWVGPQLKVDLNVETWRRGTLPDTEDSDGTHDVKDLLYINLATVGVDYEWHYTKDHSKWATSIAENWVCIADINRQTSQEKRGGGAICFRHDTLWKSLSGIEQFRP